MIFKTIKLLCLAIFLFFIWKNFLEIRECNNFAENYPNVINRLGFLSAMREFDEYSNQKYNPFFDLGSWHGFLLPSSPEVYGSFTGPMIVAEEYSVFIADYLDQLLIVNCKNGKKYDFKEFNNKKIEAYPGVLRQLFEHDDILVEITLRFASNRTALIKVEIKNKEQQSPLVLNISYIGKLNSMWDNNQTISQALPNFSRNIIKNQNNSLIFSFSRIRMPEDIMLSGESTYKIERNPEFESEINEKNLSYKSSLSNILISPNKSFISWATHSYFNNKNESSQESSQIFEFLSKGDHFMHLSKERWENYLQKAIKNANNPYSFNKLLVKSIETLHYNWRSPSGKFDHDCVTPSVTSRWFNGIWAWDSWKHAAALSYFNEELAKNVVRSMFDYQIKKNDVVRPIDEGMVIDSIFYNTIPERGGDGSNWNERNGKPPLSVWAVWQIYEKNEEDLDFLKEMYEKLSKFHRWWFTNRDCNENGVAEYGGTTHPLHNDVQGRMKYSIKTNNSSLISGCNQSSPGVYECVGIQEYNLAIDSGNYEEINAAVKAAAAWESGMDNAARFGNINQNQLLEYAKKYHSGDFIKARKDWEVKFCNSYSEKNKQINGFSINQESVDLNSFLYYEKMLLSKIANLLGYSQESETYVKEAQKLKNYINNCMWDNETGYFYDRMIFTNDSSFKKINRESECSPGILLKMRGRGTEAFIPLWANITTKFQASKIKDYILNKQEFNSFLPFPSDSLSNPAYARDIYWRGRVWLDQAYFAIKGLKNYGFNEEARLMAQKIIDHAEGLTKNETFRENYDPLTGKMADATNFGWSAAHVFLILKEILII